MNPKLKEMKNAFKSISHIEDLNRGGCLYSAYAVYTYLKNKGIESNIAQLSMGKGDGSLPHNSRWIEGNERYCDSGQHFGLTIDGKNIYDSEGRVDNYEDKLVIPNFIVEHFTISSLSYNSWNLLFNRKEGVKKLNQILDLELKLIKVKR